jgi:hypothetical protein
MFWIALAAQLSAPVTTNPANWLSGDDVPQYLISKEHGLWIVYIRLTVTPENSILGCQIERSSGISDLDDFTCRKIVDRAKFKSAVAADGSATFGVYRTSVKWSVSDTLPGDTSNLSDPDLDLFVQRLPNGAQSVASVNLMFSVDAVGQMSGCTAETRPLEPVDDPALVPVACDALMKGYKAVPAKDASGRVVPSIQDAIVRFSTSHP